MAWVALEDSGVAYTATLGSGTTLVDSVLTCTHAVPEARLVFEAPQSLRITSVSRDWTDVTDADAFSWNDGETTQENDDPTGQDWSPTPFLAQVAAGEDFSYVLGDDDSNPRSFEFLIEIDDAAVINCDCDDSLGSRTLGELTADLFTRLGFVDPMANVGKRSLKDLRDDLTRRAGNAALAGATLPPGMSDLIDGFINEAQQTLFRRLELDRGGLPLPARMTADGNLTTLDYVPVFNLALALYKAHLGAGDAKVYFEITEKFLADTLNRTPPNATALCKSFLQDAQRQLVRRYEAARMDRWFTWNLVQGVRFYDLPRNLEKKADTPCDKTIDQLAIKWVGIQNGSVMAPMRKGIPNTMVGYTSQVGYPCYYDIKQCIEVWPAPSASTGQLRIRAGFKLGPFEDDADQPSLDEELVFLFALANGMAHFKRPDAQSVMAQFSVYLADLVADSHGTARYVPGQNREADMIYTEPKPSVPFA